MKQSRGVNGDLKPEQTKNTSRSTAIYSHAQTF